MKTNLVQSVFILLAVVFAAAIQDMLPSFGGAKAPLLLLLVLQTAFTEPRRARRQAEPFVLPRWIPTALLAGAFEDALSGFPTGCSMAFMLLAGSAARFMRRAVAGLPAPLLGLAAGIVAAPFHELWMVVWDVVGATPAPVIRFFASALPAAPAGTLLFAFLPALRTGTGYHGLPDEGGAT